MPQDTPVADAKPDDIKDLLGGALFKALFKWMQESGPVYLLPTGSACSTHLFTLSPALIAVSCTHPKAFVPYGTTHPGQAPPDCTRC